MSDIKTKKNVQDDRTANTREDTAARGAKAAEKKPVVTDIDPDQYVVVRNGFQGRLVYKSPKTGERFIWAEFGDAQDMQLRELRQAKSAAKKFFENNWFMFEDEWVPEYLGVKQLYKNALSIDRFDDLFCKTPEEIEKAVSEMQSGQKRSVAYRARKLIGDGTIDSRKIIAALEKSLGTKLIED